MKTSFSIHRCTQFLKREVVGHQKHLMHFTLVMYLVLTFGLIFITYMQYPVECQRSQEFYFMAMDEIVVPAQIFFMGSLLGFACLAPSIIKYSDLKNKAKRIEQLILPVSTLEQYIAHGIICTLGFGILFLMAWTAADLTRLLFVNIYYPGVTGHSLFPYWNMYGNASYDSLFGLKTYMMVSTMWLLQSLYFFTSYFWTKMSFVKTSVFVIALLIIFNAPNLLFGVESPIVTSPIATADGHTLLTYFSTLFTISSIVLWILGYFRLKEAEIVCRK